METTDKKVSHTPGPWRVEYVRTMHVSYNAEGNPDGAVCGSVGRIAYGTDGGIDVWGHGTDVSETLANAKLIAAAPDLLDALKDAYMALYAGNSRSLEETMNRMPVDTDLLERKLVEAIKKATE